MGFIIFIILTLISSSFYWLSKLAYKRRLRRSLGREVTDRDLTSISSWMEVYEKDKPTETETRR
ncbi:MAG: hypothetical protein QOE33_1744 [Acidobacteriota bacterium]|nr:hypothetical protein [Acidobacteriota bacterium]